MAPTEKKVRDAIRQVDTCGYTVRVSAERLQIIIFLLIKDTKKDYY